MVSQACQRREWQDWAELWLCVKKFSDRLTLPALLKTRVGALTVCRVRHPRDLTKQTKTGFFFLEDQVIM
jgi:hypothetical protein